MRIRSLFGGLSLIGALLLAQPPAAIAAAPEVGAPAPEFAFVGEGGVRHESSDYFSSASSAASPASAKGSGRGVVIAWFPKAFTSG